MPDLEMKTGLIRLDAYTDAFLRADNVIDHRVICHSAVKRVLFAIQTACADASDPRIVDNPRVAAACTTILDIMTEMLVARSAAYAAEKVGFFRTLSAHRVVHRTDKAACEALGALNAAIHDAWIAAEGCDSRNHSFIKEFDSVVLGID